MARRNRNYTPAISGEPAEPNSASSSDNSGIPGNDGQSSGLSSESGIETSINPESATSPAASGRIARSRPSGKSGGNNSGGKSRKSAAESQKAAADLSIMIASAHLMLAKITSVSELDIDEDEAVKMGDAIQRVNDLFEGSVLSPKVAALGNLAFVMGSVYVPRFIAIKNNRRKKIQQPKLVAERSN